MAAIETLWLQIDEENGFLCPACGCDRVQLRAQVQRGRCPVCDTTFTVDGSAPRFHKTEPPPFDLRKVRVRVSDILQWGPFALEVD